MGQPIMEFHVEVFCVLGRPLKEIKGVPVRIQDGVEGRVLAVRSVACFARRGQAQRAVPTNKARAACVSIVGC